MTSPNIHEAAAVALLEISKRAHRLFEQSAKLRSDDAREIRRIAELADGALETSNLQNMQSAPPAAQDCDPASVDVTSPHSDGWLPIEGAPKDGCPILLWAREEVIGWWETGREFPGSDHFNDWSAGLITASGYDAGFERIHNPTHWMPLPPPPSSQPEKTI
jgi:hypothetical protein